MKHALHALMQTDVKLESKSPKSSLLFHLFIKLTWETIEMW